MDPGGTPLSLIELQSYTQYKVNITGVTMQIVIIQMN